jgi:hypothetical protein
LYGAGVDAADGRRPKGLTAQDRKLAEPESIAGHAGPAALLLLPFLVVGRLIAKVGRAAFGRARRR